MHRAYCYLKSSLYIFLCTYRWKCARLSWKSQRYRRPRAAAFLKYEKAVPWLQLCFPPACASQLHSCEYVNHHKEGLSICCFSPLQRFWNTFVGIYLKVAGFNARNIPQPVRSLIRRGSLSHLDYTTNSVTELMLSNSFEYGKDVHSFAISKYGNNIWYTIVLFKRILWRK